MIATATGDRAPVALLAREEHGGLVYVGAATVTPPGAERDLFWTMSGRLKIPQPAIPMEPRKETGWLKPEMRVRVRHQSGEDMLRHATVKAITSLPAKSTAAAARAAMSTAASASRSKRGKAQSSPLIGKATMAPGSANRRRPRRRRR